MANRQRRNPSTTPSSEEEPNWLQPVSLDPELATHIADTIRGEDLSKIVGRWDDHMSVTEMVDQMCQHDGTRSAQGKWLAANLRELWRKSYLAVDTTGRATYRRR